MCQVSELGSYANIHETADIIIDRVSVAYAAHAQDTVGRLFVRKIIDATIKGESSIKFYRRSDVVISHTGIINPISIIGIKRRHTIGFMLRFRSEEHTSELQSLMRISYAVFCLKKKKNIIQLITEQLVHKLITSQSK